MHPFTLYATDMAGKPPRDHQQTRLRNDGAL